VPIGNAALVRDAQKLGLVALKQEFLSEHQVFERDAQALRIGTKLHAIIRTIRFIANVGRVRRFDPVASSALGDYDKASRAFELLALRFVEVRPKQIARPRPSGESPAPMTVVRLRRFLRPAQRHHQDNRGEPQDEECCCGKFALLQLECPYTGERCNEHDGDGRADRAASLAAHEFRCDEEFRRLRPELPDHFAG
jgi:hypothetical protein